MPAPPNDPTLNDRIALKKGWTWTGKLLPLPNQCNYYSEWRDPKGRVDFRPDWVGTLEGVSGMLTELNKPRSIWDKTHRWLWYWDRLAKQFVCREELYVEGAAPAFRIQKGRQFYSPDDRPGDCVGDAWLSVKEAVDG